MREVGATAVGTNRSGGRVLAPPRRAGAMALVFLGAGAVAGCQLTPDPGRAVGNAIVPKVSALVDLPVGGPHIVDVIESESNGIVSQRILLATDSNVPGQNAFELRFTRRS